MKIASKIDKVRGEAIFMEQKVKVSCGLSTVFPRVCTFATDCLLQPECQVLRVFNLKIIVLLLMLVQSQYVLWSTSPLMW